MELWTILGDVVLLLSASLLLGGVFSRFGQSPMVGYLLAGMALGGPGSLHVVGSEREIEAIAELGVALLLFSLGLEFSIERLKKLGAKPLWGGIAQVAMTMLLAFAGATLCGLGPKESTAFGAMVALSSTAVVLRILSERGEIDMPHGRNSLGVLLTQDMAVVPLALLMTILGGEGTASDMLWNVGKLLLMASALIVGLLVLTRIAVLALGALTLHRNRELTVIFAVVTGLGAAWASHAVGISPALGAFVAGMLLGSSAFATQIRADVSPLQVVLLTLFFGAAGMVADPVWIVKNAHIVVLAVAALTVGKAFVVWLVFRALGQRNQVAAATALCLAQVGEFAFVLGSIGRSNGVVTESVYALVVSTAIVSFFLSAFLVPAAPRLCGWLSRRLPSRPETPDDAETDRPAAPDVAIIGFGPAGQIAARHLIDRKSRVVVIDLNEEGVRKARQHGFRGEIGDATQSEVLEHARVGECKAVVITVPHYKSAVTILKLIRGRAPNVRVFVRSRYELHTDDFIASGAHVVAGDEQQVGESLADHLAEWLSVHQAEDAAASNAPRT
ncbi:MAG: sodium:proton exchanger [Planctomycetota bacterium]|nr:MAG: sodium:proton exchanger [Planctomycetota bacterium]REJ89778.1 MAG: sodium:proton exchanger [Planctomycetota bacterium]REK21582.1 MAG: sodium:proton exchanger [Planctomycetota bacterium]REK39865.1 MAG: sodium:proton exchanger [Planctomycetota bacterium]